MLSPEEIVSSIFSFFEDKLSETDEDQTELLVLILFLAQNFISDCD